MPRFLCQYLHFCTRKSESMEYHLDTRIPFRRRRPRCTTRIIIFWSHLQSQFCFFSFLTGRRIFQLTDRMKPLKLYLSPTRVWVKLNEWVLIVTVNTVWISVVHSDRTKHAYLNPWLWSHGTTSHFQWLCLSSPEKIGVVKENHKAIIMVPIMMVPS